MGRTATPKREVRHRQDVGFFIGGHPDTNHDRRMRQQRVGPASHHCLGGHTRANLTGTGLLWGKRSDQPTVGEPIVDEPAVDQYALRQLRWWPSGVG